MEQWHKQFWQQRLENCKAALEANHFEVYISQSSAEALVIFLEHIYPSLEIQSASWADSMSLRATGILTAIKREQHIRIVETFSSQIPREELIERRRQALLVDLFLTGTNAVTETGELVNLDMIGNRVGGITFGPRHVLLVIGRNKLVKDVAAGMERIRTLAAPMNARRHSGWQTPCMKTSVCMDCNSPDRICNTWTITQKCFPPKRTKIILVNEDLGL